MDNTAAAKGVDPAPVVCEVCETYFESRRGLSSHARLHLRQLGVSGSDTSGNPIDLLYQLIQDRDGSMCPPKPVYSSPKKPKESSLVGKAKIATSALKNTSQVATGPTARKGTVLAKPRQSSISSFLTIGKKPPPSGGASLAPAKPAWAPQETDAPLTLAMDTNDEVHVCQLCGAWYESRKGLSSHCRAHLRQFGITENTETKGGPIEFLYRVMEAEDLKPIASEGLNVYDPSASSNATKRPSASSASSASPSKQKAAVKGTPPSSRPPPSKRPKPSASEGAASQEDTFATGDFICVLCGEEFENRKGLASHSRSHLRQLGVSDLLGKASAIDTVQQLVSSGVLAAAPSVRADTANTSTTRSPSPAGSPAKHPAGAHLSPLASSHNQKPRPKAKKGSTLVYPKPEPMEVELDVEFSSPLGSNGSHGGILKGSNSEGSSQSLNTDQALMVPCEFCGQLFETRKALSCHARSHLRQLGVTWSANESPITLLEELMLKEGNVSSVQVKSEPVPSHSGASLTWANHRQSSEPSWVPQGSKRTFTPPLDYSLKDKPSSDRNGAPQSGADTCCELCGFDFENRKALSSHARAHLRQLGLKEWSTEGVKVSPIELLSSWIQRQPHKAAEIHRQYSVGDISIKFKRGPTSSAPSTYSTHPGAQRTVAAGLQLGRRAGREAAGVSGGSSRTAQGQRSHGETGLSSHHNHRIAAETNTQGARGDFSHIRSPRGFERRIPKRTSHTEGAGGDGSSHQAPRSGNVPSLVPRPPTTPLVKQMGKEYTLKCRFCEAVFHGTQAVQEDWIRHLQKHILDLSFNKAPLSPTPTPDQPLSPSVSASTTAVLLAPLAV
ncbi:hypothetical protein UPYG_G00064290 [Umbra pygmaea]|uniref:C2H2-type domain-containing protein n=1 Tax=Umbra pygmaea TaxID=75934 RepID=A0ABD0XA23_UMBPY